MVELRWDCLCGLDKIVGYCCMTAKARRSLSVAASMELFVLCCTWALVGHKSGVSCSPGERDVSADINRLDRQPTS